MIKTKNSLSSMLSPKSIAIIGASGDQTKIGYKAVSNLKDIGYKGNVHLVNPKYEEIAGFPCYKDISQLPRDIDLAMVLVSSKFVLDVLEQLEKRNVKSIVIFSSGYAEIGGEGKELEEKLTEFSERTGIPIAGPNTIGLANFKEKALASFSTLKPIEPKPVGFVAQSGALGTLSYTNSKEYGIGYQYFIATGNEAATDFFDYIKYLAEQDELEVIAGYLEGARDFAKMEEAIEICHKNNKPLVLIKVGNSEKGAEAASSHTASIAGNAQLYDNYFKNRNVVRVTDEDELIDTIAVFTKAKSTLSGGDVAIITQSGGAGIIMADQCEIKNISLAKLSEQTVNELKQNLPSFGSYNNPIDITAQVSQEPELILDALKITLKDDNVESVIIYLQMTDERFEGILPELSDLLETTEKRVILCWSGIRSETRDKIISYDNICWIPSPTRTINALANVMHYYRNQNNLTEKIENNRLTNENPTNIRGKLNEWESKQLLSEYGISLPNGRLINSIDELENLDLKFPLVMKAVSSEIDHKSDFNLVQLNIHSIEEAKERFQIIKNNLEKYCSDKVIQGILVEEMAPEGIEVIVGAVNDAIFGPSIMFGLGGIFVEVIKDAVILPAPLTIETAKTMINSIKYNKILNGARGKYYDLDSLAETIVRISELANDKHASLVEFDINPIIVHEKGQGVTAVDALVVGK